MEQMSHFLRECLLEHGNDVSDETLMYAANLAQVAAVCPKTAGLIVDELEDQRASLKLIASENFSSLSCQAAMGNLLTDKYAEGFAGNRFYAGCENVDALEAEACRRARDLFGGTGAASHAYVQPHSGADANLIAFWAILSKRVAEPELQGFGKSLLKLADREWSQLRANLGNQRLLGMALDHGGHLTHGYRLNVSAKMFDCHSYGVSPSSGEIDYEALRGQAREVKPLILLAGFSAYPRRIDFRKMREIADDVGAVLMVDMAHFAGLVAGGVMEGDFDPIAHADIVTSTTHKTLRGPRGGLVLSTEEFSQHVDKGCPYVIGGPLPHVMAAKSICFEEANAPAFKAYAQTIVDNARRLAQGLLAQDVSVLSGGTDNHIVLVDLSGLQTPNGNPLNGAQAENALRSCGITLNKNTIPRADGKKDSAFYPSGLRLGTPALTTLGMRGDEMSEVAAIIALVIKNVDPIDKKKNYKLADAVRDEAKERVAKLLEEFQLYPDLDTNVLRKAIESRKAAQPA